MSYNITTFQKVISQVCAQGVFSQYACKAKKLRVAICFVTLAAYTGMLVACSQSGVRQDKSYLAPIPPATLDAYHPVWPIQSELQAVIAARREMFAAQFMPVQEPRVLSVEMTTLSEAHRRLDTPWTFYSEERPGTTSVWLIVFDGYWQAAASRPQQPEQPFYGCLSVVLDATAEGYTWVQENECPACNTSVCLTPFPTLLPTPSP
ncbi:MAG: hypothetical protein ACOYYS_15555 [Chloroflexota bacterium]